MGKTTSASSSKATKPVSAKRTVAKATKAPAKKKAPIKSNGIGIKNKKGASTKTISRKKKKVQPPMPKGWPVSSKLSYPVPRAEITVKNNDSTTADDILSLDSDNDGSSTHHPPSSSSNNIPSIPANYLTPGNLLQQSCNGSDVFLRKRAVQSTSMSFPSSGGTANNTSGPTRFLIVFPGRMSLKAPSKPTASTNAGNVDNKDDNTNDGKEDEEEDGTNTKTKKKSPFAPTHPPQLLGKLVSLGGDERNMELRIPMPSSSESSSDVSKRNQLVMSGKAIPLSGKYMALSFKRTGGAKDSTSGGGIGKNKKMGTGSIACKDIFRSVIVLGNSKLVDDKGKQVAQQKSAAKKHTEDIDVDEEKKVAMNSYGGSERTLDGGGKYNGGVTAGRKSLKATTIAAASRKRKDSISSKEIGLSSSSDESDDDIDTGSVSSDEFVPAAAKRRRKSAAGGAKRKATNESDEDDDEEEEPVAPVKKRTPRRSTGSVKVSYVDENSDVDMDDDDSDDDEEEVASSDEEEDFKPKSKPITKKKHIKKSTEKASAAGKSGSKSQAKKKGGSSVPVYNLDGDEDDKSFEISSQSSKGDEEEYEEPKAKPTNANNPPAKKASAKTKRKANTGSNKEISSAKKVVNDIIEIDSGDDKKSAPSTPTKKKVVDEKDLQAIAADAKKRLSSLSTPEKSPPKSPIARGRRKKNSPKKKSPNQVGKENDLNLDDDPFTFLSQTD